PREPSGKNWPTRHASPLIIKPLRPEGPCILTVLKVPDEVIRQFSGSRINNYNENLKQFLSSFKPKIKIIWP
ncbi:MAG: hypothetical protein NZ742_05920, partial [Acidobacteria bacterium]|nr:hypothetical protein [Acidobacteriota bacterium]MDW7984894.1 hypothetical protein [Acidobacteriota bacterium]